MGAFDGAALAYPASPGAAVERQPAVSSKLKPPPMDMRASSWGGRRATSMDPSTGIRMPGSARHSASARGESDAWELVAAGSTGAASGLAGPVPMRPALKPLSPGWGRPPEEDADNPCPQMPRVTSEASFPCGLTMLPSSGMELDATDARDTADAAPAAPRAAAAAAAPVPAAAGKSAQLLLPPKPKPARPRRS